MNSTTIQQPARRRSILGIGILALAMFAGSAGVASAASVDPSMHDGNPDCADLGFDSGFKIEGADLGDDGTHGPAGFKVIVDFSGDDGGQPTSFDFEVDNGSEPVSGVIVKAGSGALLYAYPGGADADSDLDAPDGKGISHIEFCYAEPEGDPTPEPTPEPTPTPDATPGPESTPTPEASVGGVTGTPAVTLPPTDTVAGIGGGTSSISWVLGLAVLGGILASAVVLTPSRAKRG